MVYEMELKNEPLFSTKLTSKTPESTPLLRVRDISKNFGNIIALRDVSLDVFSGEVHVLLGENGAGKTTLANILYGIYQPDTGYVEFKGRRVKISSPRDAISLGIVLVQQYPMLIDRMTVAENLVLSMRNLGMLSSIKRVYEIVYDLSKRYDIPVDPSMVVGNLSFSERQYVELLRALMLNAEVLILDEPTAMLTSYERRKLFNLFKKLVRDGKAVIMITHKVSEALEVSNRITVLRKGFVAASGPRNYFNMEELIKLIIGDNHLPVSTGENTTTRNVGSEVMVVEDLIVFNDVSNIAVKGVYIRVCEGEVVGIAGIAGNGQKELAEAISGLRRVKSGRIVIAGIDVTNKGPYERLKVGLAYIPEERLKYGIIGDMSITENMILKSLKPFSKYMLINLKNAKELTLKNIEAYRIAARGPDEKAKVLSGGNIQKLIISRELGLKPKIIVAHNPTLGLDLASSELVHRELLKARDGGAGVLLISEDLDEILKLSNRVLVMYKGSIVYEADRSKLSLNDLERAMLGLLDV